MENSNNDSNFHFKTVDIVEIVLSNGPNWIYPDRIDTFIIDFMNFASGKNPCQLIARAKKIQADGHKVIVDETAICRKETHKKEKVSVRVQYFGNLVFGF